MLIDPSLIKKRNVELWATSEAVAMPSGRPNGPSPLLADATVKAMYAAPAIAAQDAAAGAYGSSYRLRGSVNSLYPKSKGGARAYKISFPVNEV